MLTLTCNEKQLPTQLERHYANALYLALRKGPVHERPGTPWRASAKAPNAPVNLPYSPVMDDLRCNALRVERLQNKAERTPQENGRLSFLLLERDLLIQTARDALWKEPQWPYVAGLYAVRVPELRLVMEDEVRLLDARSLFRAVTVDDRDAIWPALKTALLKTPRNVPTPRPAFWINRGLYERSTPIPASLARWLVEQVRALDFDTLAPGDYRGKREAAPPAELVGG